jgi:DNA uptake protein ComE-like DNA-binding protein
LLNKLKKIIRIFFTFSKAEQYGIVVLLLLIIITTTIYFLLPYLIKQKPSTDSRFITEVQKFRTEQNRIQDSIRIDKIQSTGQLTEELAKQKLHPFIFNPNKLPKESWKKLGLTDKQIKVIKNYEAKGGRFYVKEDLKKIYCISEAEYKILEPYIEIKTAFLNKKFLKNKKTKPVYKLTEINSADTNILNKNLNFPYWMAARIIKYRTKLGGFYDKRQLMEVYGMKLNYYNKVKNHIIVDTTKIIKICINQIGFKKLLKHPYCDYKLTKKIINGREKHGGLYKNIEEVLNIIGNDSISLKLSHYLYLCAPDLRNY